MVNACNQTRHYGAAEAEELLPEILPAFSSVIPEVFSPGSRDVLDSEPISETDETILPENDTTAPEDETIDEEDETINEPEASGPPKEHNMNEKPKCPRCGNNPAKIRKNGHVYPCDDCYSKALKGGHKTKDKPSEPAGPPDFDMPTAEFLEVCCVKEEPAKVPLATLYEHYVAWAKPYGIDTPSMNGFTRRILKMGYTKVKLNGIMYVSRLRLKDAASRMGRSRQGSEAEGNPPGTYGKPPLHDALTDFQLIAEHHLVLNLRNYPEILEALKAAAKKHIRTIEHQAIACVQLYLLQENYIKEEPKLEFPGPRDFVR